jgi:hypothetical protein
MRWTLSRGIDGLRTDAFERDYWKAFAIYS